MVNQRPVQTSAVYLLGGAEFPAEPPPSPPSPAAPNDSELCTPVPALSLDPSPLQLPSPAPPATTTTFPDTEDSIATAVHVLNTEAKTLQSLANLYANSPAARCAFRLAVAAILRRSSFFQTTNSRISTRLVLSGIGKSGLIARKLAATFTSLSVPATYLHPTDALHGDLGLLNSELADATTLLLVSFSGATPELLALLPHVDRAVLVVVLTGCWQPGNGSRNGQAASCALADLRPGTIVLPAPVHELEAASFGVAAPTTSTTAAAAVGDALALAVAKQRWGAGMAVAEAFRWNHPGGAIGNAAAAVRGSIPVPGPVPASARTGPGRTVRELAVPWTEVALLETCILPSSEEGRGLGRRQAQPTAADVLRAAYASPSGWARTADGVVVFAPSRIRRLRSEDLVRPVGELPWLGAARKELVALAGETTVRQARGWIADGMRSRGQAAGEEGEEDREEYAVVAVLEKGEIWGVLEAEALLKEAEREGLAI